MDVLHRLRGRPVDAAVIDSAVERELLGLGIPVPAPTPILTAKLQSMNEHYCDFAPLLPVVRAVREQIDWDLIRRDTEDYPFAEAFLLLADRLALTAQPAPA